MTSNASALVVRWDRFDCGSGLRHVAECVPARCTGGTQKPLTQCPARGEDVKTFVCDDPCQVDLGPAGTRNRTRGVVRRSGPDDIFTLLFFGVDERLFFTIGSANSARGTCSL